MELFWAWVVLAVVALTGERCLTAAHQGRAQDHDPPLAGGRHEVAASPVAAWFNHVADQAGCGCTARIASSLECFVKKRCVKMYDFDEHLKRIQRMASSSDDFLPPYADYRHRESRLPSCRVFDMSLLPKHLHAEIVSHAGGLFTKDAMADGVACERVWREYGPAACSRTAVGPTAEPTEGPTTEPTVGPTTEPTAEPTMGPSSGPMAGPAAGPEVPTDGGSSVRRNESTGAGDSNECYRVHGHDQHDRSLASFACEDRCDRHSITHCRHVLWCPPAGSCDHPSAACDASCVSWLECRRLCAGALHCPAGCSCSRSPGSGGQWGFHCLVSERNATRSAVPVFARNRCVVEVINVTGAHPTPRNYRLPANISHYTYLKELRVEGVDLRHLEPRGPLSQLVHLQLLSLARNALVELGQFALSGLYQLVHLDLSANQLRTLHSGALRNVWSLEHLNLSGNLLYGQHLRGPLLSSALRLRVLDLSDNPVTFLPTELLEHLPERWSLREFYCRNCGITWFADQPSPFGNLPMLKALDLGGNAFHVMSELVIGVIGGLETLRLNGCAIASLAFLTPTVAINSRAYNVLVGTKKFAHVDSTVMIPTMMRFLAEQSESRKKMVPWEKNPHEVNHCEMNNRTGLPLYREILDNFTAEDYARDLFNNLTVLDLSHNFLTQITQAEMWTFARARELVLSHNYLRRLPCAPFFFMNRLEALRLSGNPWGEVRPDYFAGLEALRVVECRHCLIATFDHLATSQLEHIEELDVGDNFIETIGADQVLVLKRLQKLQLDGNRLKTVSHCVFVYNQNLKIIKLQGNDVDDTVFRDHGECAHRLQE